jgi:hypothetical protein
MLVRGLQDSVAQRSLRPNIAVVEQTEPLSLSPITLIIDWCWLVWLIDIYFYLFIFREYKVIQEILFGIN